MNKFIAAVALATLVATPALAQSYDPDVGTGNIAPAPYAAAQAADGFQAMAQALEIGIALPGDANAAAMRSAIETVLDSSTHRAKALSISQAWMTADGASNAANEIEQLLAGRRKTAA